ncbi:MAG: metallophosphoesterase [Candidatus Micrarchaeota archaeon]
MALARTLAADSGFARAASSGRMRLALESLDTPAALADHAPRRAADLETRIGRIPNEAVDNFTRQEQQGVVAVARVLFDLVPGGATLSRERLGQLAAQYPEYASAIATLSRARPETRSQVAAGLAREIAFGRMNRRFESEMARLDIPLDGELARDANILMRARYQQDLAPQDYANLDISHLYAIEDMIRINGMSEIQAVLTVARGMHVPAAGRRRASVADLEAQAGRAPRIARDFTLATIAGSGRTVIAGADYGNGVRSTNDQFFAAASSMSHRIAVREQLDAAHTLERMVFDGEQAPPSDRGRAIQANALLGNGNSDERGLVIIARRPREFESLAQGVRQWVREQTEAGHAPTETQIRAEIRRRVDGEPVVETFVLAIDKSGLGDIDRTTSRHIDPVTRQWVRIPEGHDTASVISRELFGDMIQRVGSLLTLRARDTGGTITSADITAAVNQVKAEVMGSRRVPAEHTNTVARTRDILRAADIEERSAAASENRGYRPVLTDPTARRVAAETALRERLGHEPTREQVDQVVDYLTYPDPGTYRVQVGPDPARPGSPRTLTLERYAQEYLGRGSELLAAFAYGTASERVRGSDSGSGDVTRLYELAEQRSASYTHPFARALGIESEVPQAYRGSVRAARENIHAWELQETVNARREQRAPRQIPDAERMRIIREAAREHHAPDANEVARFLDAVVTGVDERGIARTDRAATIPQGTQVVRLRWRLTEEGAQAVQTAVQGEVRRAAGESSLPRETRISRLMEEYSISEREAGILLGALDSPGSRDLTTRLFMETVPRKGLLFGTGDFSVSESNTGVGHPATNSFLQSHVDATVRVPGARFGDDNSTILLPPGADAVAFIADVRAQMARRGIHGVEIVSDVTPITTPTTLGEFLIRSTARDLGIEPSTAREIVARARLGPDASPEAIARAAARLTDEEVQRGITTFSDAITYLVHSTHPSGRERVYRAAFGNDAPAVMGRMDREMGRLPAGSSAEQQRSARIAMLSRLSGTERENYLLSSAIEEIRGSRGLRRPRDVMGVFAGNAEEARRSAASAPDDVSRARFVREERYWRDMARAVTDFSIRNGEDFIVRYHERGPRPRPGGGGMGGPQNIPLPGRPGRQAPPVRIRRAGTGERAASGQAQVIEPPGPQGLRNSGAPRATAEGGVVDLAQRRAARQEEQTVTLARSMQERLTDTGGLAQFARQVANNDTITIGSRRVRARDLLDRMDPRVQAEVRSLSDDPVFAQTARRPRAGTMDIGFQRYQATHRQQLEARVGRIQRTMPVEAEAAAATGTHGGGAAELPSAVGRVADSAGPRPGEAVAMAGSFVSPSRFQRAMGAFRSVEGGGTAGPETSRFVGQVRRRMQGGVSREQAVREVLESSPPQRREDLGSAGMELLDVAEALLSGNEARVRAAQQHYLSMDAASQEAIVYMITNGSEFARADTATRLQIAESMGRSVELEAAGTIEPIPQARLNQLARVADQLVYDGNTTGLAQIAPTLSSAEARALGRLGLLMSEARRADATRRPNPETYVEANFRDRIAPVPAGPREAPAPGTLEGQTHLLLVEYRRHRSATTEHARMYSPEYMRLAEIVHDNPQMPLEQAARQAVEDTNATVRLAERFGTYQENFRLQRAVIFTPELREMSAIAHSNRGLSAREVAARYVRQQRSRGALAPELVAPIPSEAPATPQLRPTTPPADTARAPAPRPAQPTAEPVTIERQVAGLVQEHMRLQTARRGDAIMMSPEYAYLAELMRQNPQMPLEQAARQAVEDTNAILGVMQRYGVFQENMRQRNAIAFTPELTEMNRIFSQHRDWNVRRVAAEYVRGLRSRGELTAELTMPPAQRAQPPPVPPRAREPPRQAPDADEAARARPAAPETEAQVAERYRTQFDAFAENLRRGNEIILTPEINAMLDIARQHPDWDSARIAQEYARQERLPEQAPRQAPAPVERPAPRPLELFGNQAAIDALARRGITPVTEAGGLMRVRTEAGVQFAEFSYQHGSQRQAVTVRLPEPRPNEPAYMFQHRARAQVLDSVLAVWEHMLAQSAPESTTGARRLHVVAQDLAQPEVSRYGFGSPNERAVAQQLATDSAYTAAISRGDMATALTIANRYSTLVERVQGTRATVAEGQHGYVDMVTNARQVIAIGDLHGDVYGLVDQYLRGGVLIDTMPHLPRSDRSVPPQQRYRINPDLPEGTQLVFMGDYIDRGPTSMEAIDFVRQLQADAAHIGSTVHTLRGNHEEAFMRFTRLFGSAPVDVVRGIMDGSITSLSIAEVNGVRGLYHEGRLVVGGDAFRQLEQGGFIRQGADAVLLDTELALGARNLGIAATYRSIDARYGAAYEQRLASDPAFRAEVDAGRMDRWRYAVAEMARDGTMGFLQSTRGAVVIDGNLFTHGGPMMTPEVRGAGSLTEAASAMDVAFQRMFSNPNNPWTYAGHIVEGSRPIALMGEAARGGDRTFDYVSQGRWYRTTEFGQFRDAGFGHVYVGHDRGRVGDGVRGFGDHVTNLDVSMSEAYGGGIGYAVIDPLQRQSPVRVHESRTADGAPAEQFGVPEAGYSPRDFTRGRSRTEVLGNDISRAADSVFEGRSAPPPPAEVARPSDATAHPAPQPAPAREQAALPQIVPRQLTLSENPTPVVTLERHLPPATTERNGLVRGLARDLYRYIDLPAAQVPEMYRDAVAAIRVNMQSGADRNILAVRMASMLVDTSGMVRPGTAAQMEGSTGVVSGSRTLEGVLPRGDAGRPVRQVARVLERLDTAISERRMGVDMVDSEYRPALEAITAARGTLTEPERADFIKRWAEYIITNRGGGGPGEGGPGPRGPTDRGGGGGEGPATRGPATSEPGSGPRAQAGWDAVITMGLDRATDTTAARRAGATPGAVSPLAAVARSFVRDGETAIANLPPEVQGAIRTLAANSDFSTYARGSETTFRQYIARRSGSRRPGGLELIESARSRIMNAMPREAGMPQEQRAVAGESPRGPVPDTTGRILRPGEEQPQGPLMMGGRGPRAIGPESSSVGVPHVMPSRAEVPAQPRRRGGGARERGPRGALPGGPEIAPVVHPAPRALTPREEVQLTTFTGLTVGERTPWQAVRGEQRQAVLDEVMPIYTQAYGRAGLSYHQPREIIGGTDIIFVARDSQGRAVAFATFSQTRRGLRLGLIGAIPGNAEGRGAVRAMLGSFASMGDAYGNVSAAVAGILDQRGVRIVPFAEAQDMMGGYRDAQGARGRGSSAVRDADVLRARMTPEQFAASPIVQRAIQRIGRPAAEITFSDLVDAAAQRVVDPATQRLSRHGEIPDTPTARENCFALIQYMEGPNGTRIPTVEIKLMVGNPAPGENAPVIPIADARRGRPATPPVAPPPQEQQAAPARPPAPAVREMPVFRRGVPEGATEVTGAARSPAALFGEGVTMSQVSRIPHEGLDYKINGAVVIDGVTYVRFTAKRGTARDAPQEHVLVRHVDPATMSGEARTAYYRRSVEQALAAHAETPAPTTTAPTVAPPAQEQQAPMPRAETARPPPLETPQARYERVLGTLTDTRIIELERMEHLLSQGRTPLRSEVAEAITGPYMQQRRAIAIMLESLVRDADRYESSNSREGRSIEAIRQSYPEYADAVAAIRSRADSAERATQTAAQAEMIFESRGGGIGRAAREAIAEVTGAGAARNIAINALSPGLRNAMLYAHDPLFSSLVDSLSSRSVARSRDSIALDVGGQIAQQGDRLYRSCRTREGWVRPTDAGEGLAFDAAMIRARSSGRTGQPTREDFAYGALISGHVLGVAREMPHFVEPLLQAAGRIITEVPIERIPEVLASFGRTAAVIGNTFPQDLFAIPAGASAEVQWMIRSRQETAGAVFDFALRVHLSGTADPENIFSNRHRTGLLDQFRISDENSYAVLGWANRFLSNMFDAIPQESRATMAEPALRLVLEDSSRLAPERRYYYLSRVSRYFRWNAEMGATLTSYDAMGRDSAGQFELTNRGRLPDRRLRRLPMLAVAMAQAEGLSGNPLISGGSGDRTAWMMGVPEGARRIGSGRPDAASLLGATPDELGIPSAYQLAGAYTVGEQSYVAFSRRRGESTETVLIRQRRVPELGEGQRLTPDQVREAGDYYRRQLDDASPRNLIADLDGKWLRNSLSTEGYFRDFTRFLEMAATADGMVSDTAGQWRVGVPQDATRMSGGAGSGITLLRMGMPRVTLPQGYEFAGGYRIGTETYVAFRRTLSGGEGAAREDVVLVRQQEDSALPQRNPGELEGDYQERFARAVNSYYRQRLEASSAAEWIPVMRGQLEYLGLSQTARDRRGIRESLSDAQSSFLSYRTRHLNSMWNLYAEGALSGTELAGFGRGLSGRQEIQDFRANVAASYRELMRERRVIQASNPAQLEQALERLRAEGYGVITTRDAGGGNYEVTLRSNFQISREWLDANTDLFIEFVLYRRNLERLAAGGATRFRDYLGTPEMFAQARTLLDQAFRAELAGTFRDFRYTPEFRREVTDVSRRSGIDGTELLRRWTEDDRTFGVQGRYTHSRTIQAASPAELNRAIEGIRAQGHEIVSTRELSGGRYEVSLSSAFQYDVTETGGFGLSFLTGMVRGHMACQHPRNAHPVVGGISGTVTQPWIRQVVIRLPEGEGGLLYRRTLTMVIGDDNRPTVLVQQPFGIRESPELRTAVNDAIIAQLRERYEPLGVEVRVAPGGIEEQRSTEARTMANGRVLPADMPLNRGYRTFAFRAPFAYMDSNMNEINIQNEGTRGQHGLQVANPGESLSYPVGSRLSFSR